MPDTRISDLPEATSVVGTELVPIVQQGVTKRITISSFQASTLLSYSFLTAVNEPALSGGRRAIAGTGLTLADAGAGSTMSFSLTPTGVGPGTYNYASVSVNATGQITSISSNTPVTSVAASAPPSGLSISGSPITNSGTLTFTLTNDLAALEGLSGTGFARRTGTDAWSVGAISPSDLPAASETTAGILELATQAEANSGTDDLRAITPLKMATWPGIEYTIPFGATSTANPANGDIGKLTVTGNTILQIDTTNTRHRIIIILTMDSTGGRVVTPGSNISLTGGISTLLYNSASNAVTFLGFVWNSAISKYVLIASSAQDIVVSDETMKRIMALG